MSQTPEGSTADFHVKTYVRAGASVTVMSQSPEGSTADFHEIASGSSARDGPTCLNPPKGRRPISTRRKS